MNKPVDTITLSYAQAAAVALSEAMEADSNVIALGEDLGRGGVFGQYRSTDGKPLVAQFGPDRIIDTPISESTIVGAAVGMALSGLRPVVELRVVDFALCAIDELINQAAKNRFMFGGQGRVPLVARMPGGIWDASAAQHSQSLESWFAHLPGLVVVCPSTPQDNYSLLRSALQSGDPVAYIEHKTLWGSQGTVDEALQIRNSQIAQELALPPVKIHCSILAEDAIKAAVKDYKAKHGLSEPEVATVAAKAAKAGDAPAGKAGGEPLGALGKAA